MQRIASQNAENRDFHPNAYEFLVNGGYVERKAQINGVEIYYEFSGDSPELFKDEHITHFEPCLRVKSADKPAVLIVHGWTANRFRLHPLYMFLGAHGYPTFRMDLRGHGWSQKDEDLDYSMDAFISDVYEFMKKVIMEEFGYKRIVLIGHSMGGLIVQGVLCKFESDFIEKVILLSTSPYFFDNLIRKIGALLEIRAYKKDFMKKYRKKFNGEVKMGLEFFPQWDKELKLDIPSLIPSQNATISCIKEMMHYNLKPCIKKQPYTGEVLIVTGSKDILASKRFAQWMERQYPNARAYLIEGGEHNIDIDKPRTLHTLIGQFLCGNP